MFARRLTALLLALFTLHLNLLGADFACARHGAGGSSMAEPMAGTESTVATVSSHEHASHPMTRDVGVASVSDNSSEHPPCEIPVQSNCCRALASCSVVFSAQSELQVGSALQFRNVIALGRMTAPPSETAAPEPPPPKA